MLVNEEVLPETLTTALPPPVLPLASIAEAGTAMARINAETISDFRNWLIVVFLLSFCKSGSIKNLRFNVITACYCVFVNKYRWLDLLGFCGLFTFLYI